MTGEWTLPPPGGDGVLAVGRRSPWGTGKEAREGGRGGRLRWEIPVGKAEKECYSNRAGGILGNSGGIAAENGFVSPDAKADTKINAKKLC